MDTMRTITIANPKGGSGKTITFVNLAAALGDQHRRILVLDLDPQHSTTAWFGVQNASQGVFTLFTENGNLSDVFVPTGLKGLYREYGQNSVIAMVV
jgi:chromosome partitioning protein